jgi:hypothetical protein
MIAGEDEMGDSTYEDNKRECNTQSGAHSV